MAKITKLEIKPQSGSNNTLFASWEFKEETKRPGSSGGSSSGSGTVKVGSYVNIKSGARYYNGVAIPTWVMNDSWLVIQITGDRAVLGRNKSGSNNIQSPISTKYLTPSTRSIAMLAAEPDVKTLDHYTVTWYYDTGDHIWFSNGESDTKEKYSLYNPPNNAIKVKVAVKPVSQTHTVNNKEVNYWTAGNTTATYNMTYSPPEVPPAPKVTIDKYKLTALVENVSDSKTDKIEFEILNGTKKFKSITAKVVNCLASVSANVTAGGEYRVRCRSINEVGSVVTKSSWTDYSSAVKTIPTPPDKITECRAVSETAIYVAWSAVSIATTYELQYTTEKRYFDGSDKVTSKTGIEFTHFELTGLESGKEYFIRVRAVNDQGESAWSEISSVVIGKDPSAPTTWSSSTTVITGEPLTLYWVHNSEDGSSQKYAELELYINGIKETHTIENTKPEDEKDKTSYYVVDTNPYVEGTKIEWRVRTAGITNVYGDWSIQRVIDIYAPPTLELSITDVEGNPLSVLTSFPLYIKAVPGPKTQAPLSYHVSITALESYVTTDQVGNAKVVSQGDAVYSKYFDVNLALTLELSAGHIDLENGVTYKVTVTVSMDSGLTVTEFSEFSVSWTDARYEPDTEIAVDSESFTAYLTPYCIDANGDLIQNLTLSIYRRESDGTFTEIATGLNNVENTVVADPHPSLDFARYRIVAITNDTGAVSYYDPPGYPIQEKAIIIQWDEEWSNFNADNPDERAEQPWSGSLLRLPYNVDVEDNNSVEADLISYIGRKHKVSYYGTQISSDSTWNTEIPKDDVETIYALRRLAIWAGDVYVREPSGTGYWANIEVSFSQKHSELTIPVTLKIARVEGGI